MSFLPDISVCVVCMKKVLDGDKGLQCELVCDRWFHSSCVNISDTEYRKLAANTNIKWSCGRMDCVNSKQHPLNRLIDKFDSISSQMGLILSKLDSLATLPTDVVSIKEELASVNEKLTNFEPRISDAEKSIERIDKELKALQGHQKEATNVETIVEEISERNRRSCNIIIHGLPESKSNTTKTRVDHDNNLMGLLTERFCSLDMDCSFKSYRIGKPNRHDPRPLKIMFKSSSVVAEFSRNFDDSALSDIDPKLEGVRFSRDRTPAERKHLSDLRSQLKNRTDEGEVDITIRYVNSVPKIVKKSAKNE